MKSFRKHTLQEAQTSAAFEMEKVIVAAAGGPSYTPRDKKISPDAGKKIVKDLRLTGKGQMPKNTYDVTSDWASYFPGGKAPGGTKTPKTDFIIGNKRISLKTGKGAQLMSGGKSEATATFYAACKTGAVPIEGAIKTLEGYFNQMMATTLPDVKGNAAELVKNKKSELINKTNETAARVFPVVMDVYDKSFYGRLDKIVENNKVLSDIANSDVNKVSKTFKKLPKYLSNGYQLLRLYLLKPLESKDFQPSIR